MGKKGERGTSAGREKTKSPAMRRDRSAPRVLSEESDSFDPSSLGDLSKEVSHHLHTLSTSCHSKLSLLKMQIIKCDDNSHLYSKIRKCINKGDIDEIERYLAGLEESNY